MNLISKQPLFLTWLIIVMGSCGKPNSDTARLAKPENENFTLLKHNDQELTVDLGVGLWAWPMVIDYDSDDDLDLVVLCPDTPYKGIYFFENPSGNQQMPVFKPPVKVSEGKKNLQISYVNGQPKVLGPGVEYQNFVTEGLSNPKALYPAQQLEEGFTKIRFKQWKYVDYENDGDQDILVGMDEWGDYGWDNAFDSLGNWTNGPLHGYLFLLENSGGKYMNKGKIEAGGSPIDVYGGPSANMMDFDGDGDLDIICGEFLDRFTWFENSGSRESPVFEAGRFLKNKNGLIKMDLEMFIPTAVDWEKDGDIDLIVGDEDGRVVLIENTGRVEDQMPVFESPVFFQQEADLVKFAALATPFAVDWDSDGDEDLIAGNTAGYIGFIENIDGGVHPKWGRPEYLKAEGETIRITAGDSGSIQGPAEKKWGYTVLSVGDWNLDGLNDILINSIWGKIEWFENIGSTGNPILAKAQPVKVDSDNARFPEWNWWRPEDQNLVTQWRTTPYMIDWNQDGLMDLIMLDSEGYLSFYERFKSKNNLGLKAGKRIFYAEGPSQFDRKNGASGEAGGPLRLNTGVAGKSGRRKFCFSDWDSDGDWDLLVNSKNVSLFENIEQEDEKTTFRFLGPVADVKLAGHTTSPTTVDWNKDNVPDLLVGAEDGHFYYLENSK
ncbi:MAG: VCBS repeat-containing protein [Bacteroidota bacterium]